MQKCSGALNAATLILGAALTAIGSPVRAQGPSSLLDRARDHVDRFEETLPLLVANETYAQRVLVPQPGQRRLLKAEVATTLLPGTDGMVFARNVTEVDGRAVPDSQGRLAALLERPTDDVSARVLELRDESARFNIGTVHRTLNDPTLALRFLASGVRPRFEFKPREETRVSGLPVRRFEYKETARPTLIRNGDRDVPVYGSVWITPDGVVVQTMLEASFVVRPDTASDTRNQRTLAAVSVQFARETRLSLWVPVRMHEQYRKLIDRQDTDGIHTETRERIECDARYDSYRRFETHARIVQ